MAITIQIGRLWIQQLYHSVSFRNILNNQQQQQQQTHQNPANQTDLFLSQINQQNLQSSQGELLIFFS
jgi:hypothetical protein